MRRYEGQSKQRIQGFNTLVRLFVWIHSTYNLFCKDCGEKKKKAGWRKKYRLIIQFLLLACVCTEKKCAKNTSDFDTDFIKVSWPSNFWLKTRNVVWQETICFVRQKKKTLLLKDRVGQNNIHAKCSLNSCSLSCVWALIHTLDCNKFNCGPFG